jgi:hypothetical protein
MLQVRYGSYGGQPGPLIKWRTNTRFEQNMAHESPRYKYFWDTKKKKDRNFFQKHTVFFFKVADNHCARYKVQQNSGCASPTDSGWKPS